MSKIATLFNNKGSCICYSLLTAFFTVIPEGFYKLYTANAKWSEDINVLINKIAISILVFVIANIVYGLWHRYRNKVSVLDNNCAIRIEYGDLLKINDGKVIINFDECFTTSVGDAPADIKKSSICGQYLTNNPINNIQSLIDNAGIKPEKSKSKYNSKERYKPGTLVPNGRYFLMAFAKLDKNGLGYLNYEEYIDCLNFLWKQIDLWHGTSDVYLPVLGSQITRFDRELTQQQLLDIMISSYRLSPYKMQFPFKLHIVCKKREGFSLNEIFGVD